MQNNTLDAKENIVKKNIHHIRKRKSNNWMQIFNQQKKN